MRKSAISRDFLTAHLHRPTLEFTLDTDLLWISWFVQEQDTRLTLLNVRALLVTCAPP